MKTEFGWVVERYSDEDPTTLLFVSVENAEIIWANDPYKALRFARKKDAEDFSTTFSDLVLIGEHGWEKED